MAVAKNTIEKFYNSLAIDYDRLKNKNKYYQKQIKKLYSFLIPQNQVVLDLGSGTGELLAFVKPAKGVGLDISANMISIAKRKFPKLHFIKGNAESVQIKEAFDYIILADVVGILDDIQKAFANVSKHANDNTRIIISYHSYLWEPVFAVLASLGLKTPQPPQSWLSNKDIENILQLEKFEVIKQGRIILFPFFIKYVSDFINKYVARLPIIRNLCFVNYIVARKKPFDRPRKEYSVSIILPARNESGNIETGVKEIPNLGKNTQIIFVEDHSRDDTQDEIKRVIEVYKKDKDISMYIQTNEYGKAAAVRKGFSKATGDILIVFDSDLTTDPKDLPKFYRALRDGQAEFIQGSRMIYPLEKDAMRVLNIIGNKFFGVAFTYLLDQPVKDTLCGTKILFRKDYEKILKNRKYFGNFDPFGDFDLIFGASKLNLKIGEIPIRYKARVYGSTNISRFKHGWLLLKMTLFAAKKIKFF